MQTTVFDHLKIERSVICCLGVGSFNIWHQLGGFKFLKLSYF